MMQREHVTKLVTSKRAFAARNWLKALRGLMRFAVTAGLRTDDPTAGINIQGEPWPARSTHGRKPI